MKKKQSFRKRLFLLFITSTFIPVLLVTIILTALFTTRLWRESQKQYADTLLSASLSLENHISSMKQLSLSPYLNEPMMRFYILVNKGAFSENQYLQYEATQKYYSNVRQILTMAPKNILGICFMPYNENNNECFVEYRNNAGSTVTDYDFRSAPWYQQAIASMGDDIFVPVHTVNYYQGEERNVFSLVRVIRNLVNGTTIGVIKIDSDTAFFDELFGDIQFSEHSALLITDPDNNRLYLKGNSVPGFIPREHDSEPLIDGQRYLRFTQPIKNTPWELDYLVSKNDYSIQQIVFLILLICVALVILFFAYTIFIFSSRKMSRHLYNILDTMKQIEEGHRDVRANTETHTNDEFDTITRQLNKMIESLNLHIENEFGAIISQKNAEYLALQTQINPHFLYNILNGFVTLNRIGEKALLEKSIMQLSKMFHYTCSNIDVSTIAEEFAFVEQYLALQQLRFGERLEFTVNADKECNYVPIPKLLIQPLVENAIVHGMEPIDRPVHIEVTATHFKNDDHSFGVFISVSDDGKGFNPDKLASHKGVGLTNVEERLAHFNEKATLNIKNETGGLTVCEVTLIYGGGQQS